MQQFARLTCLVFLLCSDVAAQEVDDCRSSVSLGDIDISQPAQISEVPPAEAPPLIAIVPIETALPGLANAPRAYHGIAQIALPGPSPADLPERCRVDALLQGDKPVAPGQSAP